MLVFLGLAANAAAQNGSVPSPATGAAQPPQTATTEHPSPPALFDRMDSWFAPGHGVQLQVNYTEETLGNVAGGFRRGAIYEGLLQSSLQVNLHDLMGWSGGTFFADAYYAYGAGLTQGETHDLNAVSNIDAYDSPRLFEVWLQQELWDQNFSLRAGLLSIDSEFFVVDSGAVFLNSSFGAAPYLALNVDAPIFPVSAPGVRLAWDSKGPWLIRTGIYSGDIGSQSGDNRHGTRFAFSSKEGAIAIGEVVYKLFQNGRLPGTAKVGGYYDTGEFDSLAGAGSSRGLGDVYAILDQALYRKPKTPAAKGGKEPAAEETGGDQGLNGFLRFGYSGPEKHALVDYNIQAGLTYKGLLPGRDDDVCGIGFTDTQISAGAGEFDGAPVTTHREAILEATYQAVLSEHLAVQPDFQLVFNPGAVTKASTAVVVGLRWALTF